MALQGSGEGCVISNAIAAGCFEQQIKANSGSTRFEQAIQHPAVCAPGPRPLVQALEQRVLAEIGIGGLLEAEVVDGHDHHLLRHLPGPSGLLHPVGEAKLKTAQRVLADSSRCGDQSTEEQRCAMTPNPVTGACDGHGVSDACTLELVAVRCHPCALSIGGEAGILVLVLAASLPHAFSESCLRSRLRILWPCLCSRT